jgi:DNA-3-methyladenine glycosylase II
VTVGRVIETEACVAEGAAWLAAREPRFGDALALTGAIPLRRREDGFAPLLSAIVSQQVSVASADAIWARLSAAGLTDPAALRAADAVALRACGLSRQKARYAVALAGAGIDFDALRADVFAPADLALQEAARILFALPERPGERALRAMAEPWSPWRAVAARLLWAYYRVAKEREGIR